MSSKKNTVFFQTVSSISLYVALAFVPSEMRVREEVRVYFPNSELLIERKVKSNLFNTDTKGTEPSVRFTEVSVGNGMIFGISGTK